jgi:hypothetical protein
MQLFLTGKRTLYCEVKHEISVMMVIGKMFTRVFLNFKELKLKHKMKQYKYLIDPRCTLG